MKILELFGGIGACSKALEKLGIDYEIADYVEIDKYAVASFNAIHNTNFEPQDICNWDKDIEVDLIMHGSPCQDFSLAGLQAGGDEGSGTRSSLMYETIRIVEKLKPKYVIWENVKNVISKKHKHNYDNYCNKMSELGYTNYGQVLNAKDYGIPQNRERVFTISIRKDLNQTFEFPQKQELKLKLKDMLEDEVDEKYYLSDKMIQYIAADNDKWSGNNNESLINKDIASTLNTGEGSRRCDASNYLCKELPDNYNLKIKNATKNYDLIQIGQLYGTEKEPNPQDGRIYDSEGLTPTLDTTHIPKMAIKGSSYARDFGSKGKLQEKDYVDTLTASMGTGGGNTPIIKIKNATKQGYLEAEPGDGIDISSRMQYHRGNVQKQTSQTISTMGGNNVGVVVKSKQKQLKALIEKTKFEEGKVLNMDLYNQTTNENVSQCLTEPNHNSQRLFDGLRIRKLTPKECWRLMGFDDADYEKAKKVNSNTQLYKQAGNSIVVNVLEEILKNLIGE